MNKQPDYRKALGDIADALEGMRDAFGTVGVAHVNCCVIPDEERTMMIGCALAVMAVLFEKIDSIYSEYSE
jgi:hypothetical protein